MNLQTEIITDDFPSIVHEAARGYGEKAVATKFDGKPMRVTVLKDGKPQFAIRISDLGEISLTGYDTDYVFTMPRNIELVPTRPFDTK